MGKPQTLMKIQTSLEELRELNSRTKALFDVAFAASKKKIHPETIAVVWEDSPLKQKGKPVWEIIHSLDIYQDTEVQNGPITIFGKIPPGIERRGNKVYATFKPDELKEGEARKHLPQVIGDKLKMIIFVAGGKVTHIWESPKKVPCTMPLELPEIVSAKTIIEQLEETAQELGYSPRFPAKVSILENYSPREERLWQPLDEILDLGVDTLLMRSPKICFSVRYGPKPFLAFFDYETNKVITVHQEYRESRRMLAQYRKQNTVMGLFGIPSWEILAPGVLCKKYKV
jgi:hypothetical protein